MNKVNSLVLCREDYKSQEIFENEIKKAVMLLLDAEYIVTVRYDEKGLGIIVIDYDYADKEYGNPYPHWLTPEEEESLMREKCDDDNT